MNFDVPFAITKRLHESDMSAARTRVVAALQAEGFGVLTEIDVQATLHKKLGTEIAPYLILGACNPELAQQALNSQPAAGLLLPCNVVLAQDGTDVIVSAASPIAMFRITGAQDESALVAEQAEQRIRRAIQAV